MSADIASFDSRATMGSYHRYLISSRLGSARSLARRARSRGFDSNERFVRLDGRATMATRVVNRAPPARIHFEATEC